MRGERLGILALAVIAGGLPIAAPRCGPGTCTPDIRPTVPGPGFGPCFEDDRCGFGCWVNENADLNWRWVPWPKESPTPSPSPTPTPSPTPSPTSTPTPVPTPSPTPSPTPTPTPTPLPTPTPTPTPCATPLPNVPIPPAKTGPCPPGTSEVAKDGRAYCFALSDCPDGAEACTTKEGAACRPCAWQIQFDLNAGHKVVSGDYVLDPGRDLYDRYCRRTDGARIITGWDWSGVCAPRGEDRPCPEPTPTPSPTPTPPSDKPCPAFKLVRGSLLACQTREHITSCAEGTGEGTGKKCDPLPVEGGSCTVDTTQTFEGCVRGCPCDDGHPCDGRTDCYDPRGQEWSWTPDVQCAPDNSPAGDPNRGFQLDCRHLARGTVTWTACVPNNGRTARGEPWVFTGASQRCVTGTFEVK